MNRAIAEIINPQKISILGSRAYTVIGTGGPSRDSYPNKKPNSGEVNPADQQKDEKHPEFQNRKKKYEHLDHKQHPEADR